MRLDSEGILEDVLGDRQTRFFSDLEHLESVASAEIDEGMFVGAEVHGTVFIPVTVMVPSRGSFRSHSSRRRDSSWLKRKLHFLLVTSPFA
jgi:hypothetical protein